jgi:hypothetical protein
MPVNHQAQDQKIEAAPIQGNAKPSLRVLHFLFVSAVRSAWRSLKNCLRLLWGRPARFDEHGLFLRQYILHITGLRPIRNLTCTGLPSEGAGSQALMVMNAINFARSFGLTYLHTPFIKIQHAERPMNEWAAAWETLFNLGANELACKIDRRDVANFSYNYFDLDLCLGWRSHWDQLGDRFKDTIPEFRRKYYSNKSPRTTEELTAAVHVRRGDVSADNSAYFTGNQTILRTITQLRSILDAHNSKYNIRIYSQGVHADFAELLLPGVELFLNADAIWTMRELIEADILIMAQGCFSYYAALISDGIRIFEPGILSGDDVLPGWKWRSAPLSECWIASRMDGSFDATALENQLQLLIRAKEVDAQNTSHRLPPEALE